MSYRDETRLGLTAMCGRLLAWGALLSLLALPTGRTATAEDGGRGREAGADRALRLLTLVPVPPIPAQNNTAGAMYSFDISYVDQSTQTYYLADRSNKAVDVVDARTGQFKTQIFANPASRGFTPCPSSVTPPPGTNDCAGPDGVVAAFPWLSVTDTNSR